MEQEALTVVKEGDKDGLVSEDRVERRCFALRERP